MADNAKKDTTEKKTAAAPTPKEGIATFNQDEAKKIKVRAADGTQLYDPVTRTTYTDKKDGVEALDNNQFVQTNLNRGKLKKVN